MKEILMKQFARYPQMKIEDAVKLLFQSEFGGGHMVANPAKSLERIWQEWQENTTRQQERISVCEPGIWTGNRQVDKLETGNRQADGAGIGANNGWTNRGAVLPYEEIGDGICRLYLSALDEGLLPETLNQMFVRTADQKIGKKERFEKKLELLLACCESGELPFAPDEVRAYLSDYQAQGYPPVSHSDWYHSQYHPSYRVVSECYTRYYPVFLAIDRACTQAGERQVTVAIDGMCGSGKSTLGRILKEIYDCNLFHMDDFFLRPEQRTEARLKEIGGNVDYERFADEVLGHLADPEGFRYQVFDCGTRTLAEMVQVPYRKLNIIEGSYSQHPSFGDIYDLRFFYGIDNEEQKHRILKRNGAVMLERFINEWIPMENRYLETFGIKERSILV